eukprot:COSAG04_NODE_637_length_11700_cov_478.131885_7_plen_365_part_00
MCLQRKCKPAASDGDLGEGFETNPLAIELGESAAEGKDDGSAEPQEPTAQPARAKLAKMQREGKDARAQVQKLQAETQQQQVDNQQLREDNAQQQAEIEQLQAEVQQLEAQSEMDGDAVRKSEATLRKDNETLRKENAALKLTSGSVDEMQMVPVSGGGEATSDTASAADQPVAVRKSQEDTLKELATDESLSEEARASAQKALEVLVSSQLVDIERIAALKKRDGALEELESEAQFAKQQSRIEQKAALDAALLKREAEALTEVKMLEADAELKRKRQEALTKNLEADAQAAQFLEQKTQFMDDQQHSALQKLQAKAQLLEQKAQACQQLESATKGVSEEMTEWLSANRLQDYAAHMALIAGS